MIVPPLIVVRPQPGADATVARARASGLDALAAPLFAVAPVAWTCPDAGAFDTILLTSANAARLAAPASATCAVPVHAVGAATAAAARAAGFALATVGTGGVTALLAQLPPDVRLLWLAGRDRTAIADPRIVAVREVYANRAGPLPDAAVVLLTTGARCVALHSARAAAHLAAEVDRRQVPRHAIALACLSPDVAAAAGGGWRALAIAAAPRDAMLLNAARSLYRVAAMPAGGRVARIEGVHGHGS